VRALAISPNGTRLAVLSSDEVQLWTRGGHLLWTRIIYGDPQALAWKSDGSVLAVGVGGKAGFIFSGPDDSSGALELDARNGKILRKFLDNNNTVSHLAYLPNGDIQVEYFDGSELWNAEGTKLKNQPTQSPIVPSPDGHMLAVLTTGVQIWDSALTAKEASIWKKGMPVGAFAWSPDGQRLAVSDGHRLQTWNVARRTLNHEVTLPAHGAKAPKTYHDTLSLTWAGNDQIYVARTDFPDFKDKLNEAPEPGRPRSYLWRITPKNRQVDTLRDGTRNKIGTLAAWPDGSLILGGADNHEPELWHGTLYFAHIENGAMKAFWGAPPALQTVNRLQISPDGSTLAAASDDTAIRLWDLKTGKMKKTLKVFSSELLALAWSPSGDRIAALDFDHLFIFIVATGKARRFKGIGIYSRNASVAWSPDGKLVAFSGGIGLRILQLSNGKERQISSHFSGPLRWTNQGIEANGGIMSDDPQRNNMLLLDPQNGRILNLLDARSFSSDREYYGAISGFQFFDDGQKLWTLNPDEVASGQTVKLWDVKKHRVERTLPETYEPSSIALSPDETTLIVGSKSGHIQVWNTTTFQSIWQRDTDAPVQDIIWSPSGDAIFVAGADGRTRVLAPDGTPRATLIALPELNPKDIGYEWINFTPKSTFMASPKATNQVHWREDGKLLPLTDTQRVTTIPLSTNNRTSILPRLKTGLTPTASVVSQENVRK
jgi:WD40 repeat protein